MWRNTDVVAFVDWLRAHNDTQPIERRAGFYGIDLYSFARRCTRCSPTWPESIQKPRRSRGRGMPASTISVTSRSHTATRPASGWAPSCEREVVTQLVDLQRRRAEYATATAGSRGRFFYAEQNARLVRNAERYYRTMFRGRNESWNLRDRHMADTIDELLRFLEQRAGARGSSCGRTTRIWATRGRPKWASAAS